MKSFLIPAAVLVLCAASAPALATPGTILRNDKLYSQPNAGASVQASVVKGARVEILAKQGGWLRVNTGKSSGWVRLLSVRAGAGGLSGGGLGDVVGAATTKSDPSRVVAVAGLRGLNDEDLKQAKFNAEEFARFDALGVTPAQAKGFAEQAGLAVAKVPDLPGPQPKKAASSWENN